MEPNIRIERTAVIGFVVTQAGQYFYARPLIGDCVGYFESPLNNPLINNDELDEKVIGVLPAPQNTFSIWGCGGDTDALGIDLGYEFAGASNIDWGEIYLEKRRKQDAKNSEPVEGDILTDAEDEQP